MGKKFCVMANYLLNCLKESVVWREVAVPVIMSKESETKIFTRIRFHELSRLMNISTTTRPCSLFVRVRAVKSSP